MVKQNKLRKIVTVFLLISFFFLNTPVSSWADIAPAKRRSVMPASHSYNSTYGGKDSKRLVVRLPDGRVSVTDYLRGTNKVIKSRTMDGDDKYYGKYDGMVKKDTPKSHSFNTNAPLIENIGLMRLNSDNGQRISSISRLKNAIKNIWNYIKNVPFVAWKLIKVAISYVWDYVKSAFQQKIITDIRAINIQGVMLGMELLAPLAKDLPGGQGRLLNEVTEGKGKGIKTLAQQLFKLKIFWTARFYYDDLKEIVSNRLKVNTPDKRPLAIIIGARADGNGTLIAQRHIYNSLIARGYRVVYYEVETDAEAVKSLKEAARFEKASLIMISGHGYKKGVALGYGKNEKYWLDYGDRELLEAGNTLKKGGVIIVNACSVAEGGRRASNFAKGLAYVFPQAKHIFAANRPAGLIGLGFNDNNEVTSAKFGAPLTWWKGGIEEDAGKGWHNTT